MGCPGTGRPRGDSSRVTVDRPALAHPKALPSSAGFPCTALARFFSRRKQRLNPIPLRPPCLPEEGERTNERTGPARRVVEGGNGEDTALHVCMHVLNRPRIGPGAHRALTASTGWEKSPPGSFPGRQAGRGQTRGTRPKNNSKLLSCPMDSAAELLLLPSTTTPPSPVVQAKLKFQVRLTQLHPSGLSARVMVPP